MTPLADGSVSLGLSLPAGPVRAAVAALRDSAARAVDAGFDGVTLSEHHAGSPGYVPAPLLLGGLLLEHLTHGWAIACPAILPLRRTRLVVEELAWLAAAHPGRVAAGFVPGYQQRDFAIADADFTARTRDHWSALAAVTAALRGSDPPDPDPAVAACAPAGLPVVSGVAGPVGARRAARAGAGLLLLSLAAADDLAEVVAAYRAAGGTGPRVLIRRVWAGDGSVAPSQLDRWRAEGGAAGWLAAPGAGVATGAPAALAAGLAADLARSGATALNLRVDAATPPAELADQITRLGREVLPRLRSAPVRPTTA